MAAVERFDIEKVTQIFQNCLKNDDDILLDEYLLAYEEINKFFHLLGTVFGFVSSDVRSKIDILTTFRKEPDSQKADQFITVKTMMLYEKETNLLNDTKYVSGSRTLLRLHRGLEFVYEFLYQLADLAESEKVHGCCKSAYESTLAKHHPWMIRKGALVAMYALPTQGELLKRVCANVSTATEVLPEMLKSTKTVYDRTHALYTIYDLHSLP